jgi:hypothetical protein
VDFDPGTGTSNLTSAGSADIFISKLDASGNFLAAKNMGGTLSDGGNSMKVDLSNNIYLTGDFRGTADFDPNAGTVNLTSAGEFDAYIVKLNQSGSLPITLGNAKAYEKNTGVQVEWSTLTENEVERFDIETSQTGQQFFKVGSVKAKGNSGTVLNYNFFNPNPLSGAHFYRLKVVDKSGEITYSSLMKINLRKASLELSVYPNPIIGNTFGIQLKNLPKGSYVISLTNKLGQQILSKAIEHKGGSLTENIEPSQTLLKGSYHLKLTGEGINVVSQVIKN